MLPALNDVQGNVEWLETWRASHRDDWTVADWELVGQAVSALRRLSTSRRPKSLGIDAIMLHNGLHRMAARRGLGPDEQSQLSNAARLLWWFGHGLTARRFAEISARA